MNEPILLEEMAWPDVKEAIDKGKDTVVIMVGSIEQHGPHLPIASDTLRAYELGKQVVEKLKNALLAPVIRPGCSDHHMRFPGTITLRSETLTALLMDYCKSLAQHGFKRIVICSTHGGNFDAIEAALPQIACELPDIQLIWPLNREDFLKERASFSNRHGLDRQKAGIHAGELETSEVLVAAPELVNMQKAEKGWMGEVDDATFKILRQGIHNLSTNGVLGDPREATAEKGEISLHEMSNLLVQRAGEKM